MQLIFHFGKLKNTNIKYVKKKKNKKKKKSIKIWGICLVDVNKLLESELT